MIKEIKIHNFKVGGKRNPFFIISGPCVIENEKIVMKTASAIKNISVKLKIPFIFKSSYKKDNRGITYEQIALATLPLWIIEIIAFIIVVYGLFKKD